MDTSSTTTQTATPTNTGIPIGGACVNPLDCASTNCVTGVCASAPAAAPAVPNVGLAAMLVARLGVALVGLRVRLG